jgi:hypothetical protein
MMSAGPVLDLRPGELLAAWQLQIPRKTKRLITAVPE